MENTIKILSKKKKTLYFIKIRFSPTHLNEWGKKCSNENRKIKLKILNTKKKSHAFKGIKFADFYSSKVKFPKELSFLLVE